MIFDDLLVFTAKLEFQGRALSLSLRTYCICVYMCSILCVDVYIYTYVQICTGCRYINSYDAAGRFGRRKLCRKLTWQMIRIRI